MTRDTLRLFRWQTRQPNGLAQAQQPQTVALAVDALHSLDGLTDLSGPAY